MSSYFRERRQMVGGAEVVATVEVIELNGYGMRGETTVYRVEESLRRYRIVGEGNRKLDTENRDANWRDRFYWIGDHISTTPREDALEVAIKTWDSLQGEFEQIVEMQGLTGGVLA